MEQRSIFTSLANPVATQPAIMIGGNFGWNFARCFGSMPDLSVLVPVISYRDVIRFAGREFFLE